MAGSTPESRAAVDGAVQAILAVGDSLRADELVDLQPQLGLGDAMSTSRFKRTLQSMKYCADYRTASCFTLSDSADGRGHSYVLTRTR